MKKLKFIGNIARFVILLAVIANTACAYAEIQIISSGEMFRPGDLVSLGYNVTNWLNEKADFEIEDVMISPLIPPMPGIQKVTLDPSESLVVEQISFKVSETTKSGNYSYFVKSKSDKSGIHVKQFRFEIYGTLDLFRDAFILCSEDPENMMSHDIFRLNDSIYCQLFNHQNATVEARLMMPNNTVKKLYLEDYKVMINEKESGAFTFELILSKEGFKTQVLEKRFIRYDKEPEVKRRTPCNYNIRCEFHENYQNCPQDCPSGSLDGICDGIRDGLCDPDCRKGQDPDCIPETDYDYRYILLLLTSLVIIVIMLRIRGWIRSKSKSKSSRSKPKDVWP